MKSMEFMPEKQTPGKRIPEKRMPEKQARAITTKVKRASAARATRRRTPTMRTRRALRQSGFTIIEALVASLIMSMSVAALVTLWNFAFRITTRADSQGVAYNIGRHAMEQVKQAGYDFAADGTTIVYFSEQGVLHTDKQPGDAFQVTTGITSQAGYPSYDATRTVTITVVALTTGEQMYRTGMLLVKAGI